MSLSLTVVNNKDIYFSLHNIRGRVKGLLFVISVFSRR